MTVETSLLNEKLLLLASEYSKSISACLGDRLVSVVLFGSVARGEASPNSDIDLLIVARDLPRGQLSRKRQLAAADDRIEGHLTALAEEGVNAVFTRILKTPEEAVRVVPLYLDLVEDAVLLLDRDDFFKTVLSRLETRLRDLGARRLSSGRIRYWDLKPDLRIFERFTL